MGDHVADYPDHNPVVIEPKSCDYCGEYITQVNQICPARHDGYCLENWGDPGAELMPRGLPPCEPYSVE
jgi:hypothetical protein